ncbi:MAG: S8 family serine peptidase [Crocosphaera sp.]|nr:S8 family serine peptidase [Crocosphaera sp.]
MTNNIRVRLVPKTKDNRSITVDYDEISSQSAKLLKPDAGKARSALRPALSLGISAKVTGHNSLEGDIPRERFKELFGTTLEETSRESISGAEFSSATPKSFTTPRQELKVPKELQDTIAFAYVPTPPEFFSMSTIPPNVSVYHLRLEDVSRILEGTLCHRRGWTGRNIKVAMTDSGFASHPYFNSQGYRIERVIIPGIEHPLIDISGHGTGESANVLIMAPDCHFVGIKHDNYSALAIETALEQNPRIITNSWGWDIDRQSKEDLKKNDPNLFNEIVDLENIISDAIDDGVTVIFAAGNGHKAFPACMPEVISVGGVTALEDGSLVASSYASSFRSQMYPNCQVPDICGIVGEYSQTAPLQGHIMLPVPSGSRYEGKNMPDEHKNKGWGIFSGTSASAPQVAGLVALILQINPDISPNQIKSLLSDTAKDIITGTTRSGDNASLGYDLATGAGLVRAFKACLQAEALSSG